MRYRLFLVRLLCVNIALGECSDEMVLHNFIKKLSCKLLVYLALLLLTDTGEFLLKVSYVIGSFRLI